MAQQVSAPARPRQSFWRAAAVNARVIGALLMRDGTMRYGHENLGFFWVIGEPLDRREHPLANRWIEPLKILGSATFKLD